MELCILIWYSACAYTNILEAITHTVTPDVHSKAKQGIRMVGKNQSISLTLNGKNMGEKTRFRTTVLGKT